MLALSRQEDEEGPVADLFDCDSIQSHALLVGANGCSPEEDFLAGSVSFFV